MRRSPYSDQHILAVLKEAEAGPVLEVIRRHGITPKTYSRWKAKFPGMSVPEARMLRQIEEENARLKRVVADHALDNSILKDLMKKFS